MSLRHRAGLTLATVLCLAIGGYGAVLVASGFTLLPSDIAANGLPLAVKAHIATASVALLLSPWQLWPGLRRRRPGLHRWIGRGYVVSALAGGLTGVAAATATTYGAVAGAGFAVLGVLWVASTWQGLTAARARDLMRHRQWMVRSFALAFAAVTLRFYLPLAAVLGIDFAVAYPVVAWLSWVPNLLVAEVAVRRMTPSAKPASPHPTAARLS